MVLGHKQILLVEDNEDDVFLMQRALKKAALPWTLQVVMDGQAALDYLGGNGKYADRNASPLPGLIFLDLKLPYLNGFEVLAWLRQEPALNSTPVVVLTSSPEARDQQRAAELGANAYLLKPPGEDALREIENGDWSKLDQRPFRKFRC